MRKLAIALLVLAFALPAAALTPDGRADWQVDRYGYYYAVSGSLFPTGTIPNGDNGSGGVYRFLCDDPGWGQPLNQWVKDDWYPQNAGLALTLKNGQSFVYDNNGFEPGAAVAANQANYNWPAGGKAGVLAYCMPNNFDFTYASYVKFEQDVTFTDMIGYFAMTNSQPNPLGDFTPGSPDIEYAMNLWSNKAGDLLPAVVDFEGDVLNTNKLSGTWSWSDTGYDRIGSASTQHIYRLVFHSDEPITVPAGIYWFNSEALVVPEPLTMIALFGGVASVGAYIRRRVKA